MLAAPMPGKTVDELVGEDVRQHRRTQALVAVTISALALLVVLLAGAATIATRTAQALQAKLTLVERALPLFQVRPDEARQTRDETSSWRRFVSRLRESLSASAIAETWVEFGPMRLGTGEDCADARARAVVDRFQCPAQDSEFDAEGLRTDIPGLSAIGEAVSGAAVSGRLLMLLETSRLGDDTTAPGQEPNYTVENEEQELVALARMLMSERTCWLCPKRSVVARRRGSYRHEASRSGASP